MVAIRITRSMTKLVATVAVLLLTRPLWAALPHLDVSFKSARAWVSGNDLIVTTGRIERRWRWTGRGFLTTCITNLRHHHQWNHATPDASADWAFPSLTGGGKLISLRAHEGNNQGFTSAHLTVQAVIVYPRNNIALRYVIWAFPGVSGLRTQVQVRRLHTTVLAADHPMDTRDNYVSPGVVDRVPVNLAGKIVTWIGYYADTQRRDKPGTPILRTQRNTSAAAHGKVMWASVADISDHHGNGLILVKESHKCVNTPHLGANTGWFQWNRHGLANTGTGWFLHDVHHSTYHECWASWVIVYHGNGLAMQHALKRFDRTRFPIHPRQDIYIMTNTWGDEVARGARLNNVLKEIKSQANLGIDALEIDGGWKRKRYNRRPSWRPVYPDGWKTIRARAAREGVRLGLWCSTACPYKDMAWNYDHGGFRYFKIDLGVFPRMRDVARVTARARRLILLSHHRVSINWDITEKSPRIGYYFGRQYGNIFLENRQTQQPQNVIYVPYLVLRDAWQVAKYVNLNEFQIPTSDVDLVSRTLSDAWRYTNSYCFMQTIMGSPIFFTPTHLFTPATRQKIRKLIAVYKAHRSAMYAGYVFPIGKLPDNATWSGFQNQNFRTDTGFITLFRQVNNHHEHHKVALDFVARRTLTITNLLTRTERTVHVPASGKVNFTIPTAPGFLYLQYKVASGK